MSFRLREEHVTLLTEFMENHPDFATGRLSSSNARTKFRELWRELTNSLNALGFGTRTVDKWQKTWTDYKVNLKKKASEIKRHQEATGGGPEIKKKLTEFELRILSLLGQTFYAGCGVMEHGVLKGQTISADRTNQVCDTDQQNISSGTDMGDNITANVSLPCLPSTSNVRNIFEVKSKSSDHITDHDYLVSPTPLIKKRKTTPKTNEMNLVYQDTINYLKNIENTIDNRLRSLEATISNKFDALTQTIQNEVRSVNMTLRSCFDKGE